MDPRSLGVIFWNARSLYKNLSEFKNFLCDENPHIVGVCETWLKGKYNPKFSEYNLVRKDRATGRSGGGVAFLIKKGLNFGLLDLEEYHDGSLEVLGVRVAFDFGWGFFYVFYNPCKAISEGEFDFYFNKLSHPCIVMGDFNAKHSRWDQNVILSRAKCDWYCTF